MPGIMIERPKMTRTMYQALKRHIMKEREKKKQEQEQDEELARQKKERELKKKKEQEDSLTLGQTKDQVSVLEKKVDKLRQDKHEFFSQLKKVLHQEDESRKRAQMKENEMVQTIQQQYQQPLFLQGHGHITPQTKYMNVPVHRSTYGSNKRPRSPSPPPPVSVYGAYPASNKYHVTAYGSNVKQQDRYPNQKTVTYTTPSSYVTQSAHTFPASQHGAAAAAAAAGIYQTTGPSSSSSGGKYGGGGSHGPPPPGQSAFTSYSNHYVKQQQQQLVKEQPQQPPQSHYPPGGVPAGYRVQLPPQGRAFIPTGHGNNMPLQQQLQHADKKSGFAEDKFKLQSGAVRSMPQHISNHQPLVSQQPPIMVTQQPPKGGITSGFPVRSQPTSSSYQPPSQAVSSSTQHPYAHPATHPAVSRYYRQ